MTEQELQFIEASEIAELLEVTKQRVSSMTREGIIEQDGQGRYPRRETIHALFRWYRMRLGEGKSAAAVAKQEAQLLQNEILKATLQRSRGETVTIVEADKVMADHILRARDKLLRIGNKLAGRIPYLKDVSAIEDEIRREIEDALGELARPIEYRPESDQDAEAA